MNPKAYWLLIMFLIALFTWGYSEAGNVRLYYLNSSKHYTGGHDFNEDHDGKGFEARMFDDNWVGYLDFTNSFNDPSRALYYTQQTPTRWFYDYGFQIGLSEGYEDHNAWLMFYVTLPLYKDGDTEAGIRILGIPGAVLTDQYYVEW